MSKRYQSMYERRRKSGFSITQNLARHERYHQKRVLLIPWKVWLAGKNNCGSADVQGAFIACIPELSQLYPQALMRY